MLHESFFRSIKNCFEYEKAFWSSFSCQNAKYIVIIILYKRIFSDIKRYQKFPKCEKIYSKNSFSITLQRSTTHWLLVCDCQLAFLQKKSVYFVNQIEQLWNAAVSRESQQSFREKTKKSRILSKQKVFDLHFDF